MADGELRRVIRGGYEEVLAKVPEALQAEGFGVLTRIDVQATLAAKLGVPFRRFQILGACNPAFAHRALTIDLGVGVLLPCNVAVHEADDGATVVSAVDPLQTIGARDPRLLEIAREVRERLVRALGRLGG